MVCLHVAEITEWGGLKVRGPFPGSQTSNLPLPLSHALSDGVEAMVYSSTVSRPKETADVIVTHQSERQTAFAIVIHTRIACE